MSGERRGVGRNFGKVENEVNQGMGVISGIDIDEVCGEAKGGLLRKSIMEAQGGIGRLKGLAREKAREMAPLIPPRFSPG